MTRSGKARRLRALFALLLAALALLVGCGYWVIEDAPIQVGDAIVRVTQAPEANP